MSFSHGSPSIPTSGLQFYVDVANPRSYVSGSNKIYDLSGNNYTGSLINTPIYNSANGGYLSFSSSSQHYIDFTDVLNLVGSAISGIGWVYVTSYETFAGGHSPILNKFGGSGNFRFSIGGNGAISIMRRAADSNTSQVAGDTGEIPLGVWAHVAFTDEASGSPPTGKLYKNGYPSAAYPLGTVSRATTTTPLRIGYEENNVTYLNGRFAQALLYNTRLTDAEILQHFNATRWRFGI